MAADVHQIITDKIVAALEAHRGGEWSCPWHRTGGGLPINAVTRRSYRGINVLALWVAAAEHGYAESRWATYRQWESIGTQVRRGEKGTIVVFWKELASEPADEQPDAPGRRLVARASFVFNAAQANGLRRARSFARQHLRERRPRGPTHLLQRHPRRARRTRRLLHPPP